MILYGLGVALIRGTPCGRQFALDSSLAWVRVPRSLKSASAAGRKGTSPGLRSAAMFTRYFGPLACQIPDKSGLPSGVLGAGTERFGLPSGSRGMPLVG